MQEESVANETSAERAKTAEELRLDAAREQGLSWRQWGPYLSERQWGSGIGRSAPLTSNC
jgi:hypothetical protein